MKKILSIDGGGIKGIIPAILLKHIEEKAGIKIIDKVDFMTGTSTGGIIALLLTCQDEQGNLRYDIDDIIDFYVGEPAKKIFKKRFTLNFLSAVKYPSENIDCVLRDKFTNSQMKNCRVNVMIPTYNTENMTAKFFNSANYKHRNIYLRDLARATSAAPTYFEPHNFSTTDNDNNVYNYTCLDGGLFANNPALNGVVEIFKQNPNEEFKVISLGTGLSVHSIPYNDIKKFNLINWATGLFTFVSDGQSDVNDYVLSKLLHEDNYFRFQCDLSNKLSSMDNLGNINALINTTKKYINNEWKEDIDRLVEVLSE